MLVVSEAKMLRKGLKYAGFSRRRQDNVALITNLGRFQSFYGSKPIVYARIIEDLQTTHIPSARIVTDRHTLKHFLLAIHWLRRYGTEAHLSGMFGLDEKTCRKYVWYFCSKIQALKEDKICWPDNWAGGGEAIPKFLFTVDGVHCSVREPSTAEFSKDPSYYSHKHNRAGLCYEIGLSIFTNQLVWVNGPFPAGENDVSIFKNKGLQELIPEGHWAVADNGYRGAPAKIRTSNSLDTAEVRRLKCRAKARHESFNGRLKSFAAVGERWRHCINKHDIAFEAVCVICQYQLENGSPIYKV